MQAEVVRWRLSIGLPVRLALVAAFAAALLASGCSWLEIVTSVEPRSTPEGAPESPPESAFSQITCETDTVTLAWDPPTSEVTTYKVFYREHGTGDWTLLTEVPAQADPSLSLHQSDFGIRSPSGLRS